jgi:hypothetical protein
VTGVPFTFAAVAQPVAAHGWRPFPGLQTSKVPAMREWSGLNRSEWDGEDLAAAVADYQPVYDFCCCLAVQSEIVVLDADIVDPAHATFANKLADDILGVTPLVRIGLAPKCIRIYRAGDSIKSRKLHPLEIFCGSGQFIGFGWHEKAGRPYIWPHKSPLTLDADSHAIPAVKQAQIERFTTELFKVVPRRLVLTRQGRPGGAGAPQTIGERLRMLTTLHGSWKRAAAIVLSEACDGCYNETLWAVVTSANGRGVSEDVIWDLFDKHFHTDCLTFPKLKWSPILASMIERARARCSVGKPAMIFTPPFVDRSRS